MPDEEKYNLPWATEVARGIADEYGKRLIISYSTEQLHLEAEERGFGWDNVGPVVELLAPYGDLWLIQAADEYNDPYYNPEHPEPILSQRHFLPGPEWRAEAEKWVNWIRSANPDIEIWIQLALHRIPAGPPPWEDNYPSAELLLEYREWLVNPEYGPPLVDGVFVSSVYSWPIDPIVADQELEEAFRTACGGAPESAISLVEEGWTDDVVIEGLTMQPGYYYRLYENSQYPCGAEGNHQFLVLDSGPDASVEKNLFVKFMGGAVGFWYLDAEGNRVYYPQENAVGLLNETTNRTWMFMASASVENANGVTKRMRENPDFRVLVPSYCSHDFYHGRGEYDETDGYSRYGYVAAMEAVDYVQVNTASKQLIVYGGSAGAAGYFVGNEQDKVAGIIMDSQAVDMTAISDACKEGYDAFGGQFPCFCPEGGPTCMEALAPRIGFELGVDEPYHAVERGEVQTPIFMVWNAHDASSNAHYQYDNLHQALKQYNPGGQSVACRVCLPHADDSVPDSCIPDDDYAPIGTCNLHVPTAYDYDFTASLVQEVYDWALARIAEGEQPRPQRPALEACSCTTMSATSRRPASCSTRTTNWGLRAWLPPAPPPSSPGTNGLDGCRAGPVCSSRGRMRSWSPFRRPRACLAWRTCTSASVTGRRVPTLPGKRPLSPEPGCRWPRSWPKLPVSACSMDRPFATMRPWPRRRDCPIPRPSSKTLRPTSTCG